MKRWTLSQFLTRPTNGQIAVRRKQRFTIRLYTIRYHHQHFHDALLQGSYPAKQQTNGDSIDTFMQR